MRDTAQTASISDDTDRYKKSVPIVFNSFITLLF